MTDSYKEWKAYFDLREKDMRSNPTHCRYEKAFFRLGKKDYAKDVLYFPVEIRSGRLSFGKVQFLVTPFGVEKGILGQRWVERKALVMQHDQMFEHLQKAKTVIEDETEENL